MAVVASVEPVVGIVGGIMKPKRVKKAIMKPLKSDNAIINVEKGLISLITLHKDSINDDIQPTIANIASKIEVIIPKNVKTKKPLSKTGSKIDIAAETTPSTLIIDPILKANIPINGIKENIVLENSVIQLDNPEDALMKVAERTVGRPLGSLDKVKRHALGDHKLGRPPGSKDTVPRKPRIRNTPNVVEDAMVLN